MIALHVQILWTDVGKGLGVLCFPVLGCIDLKPIQVQQAFMSPAVEQVHVTQKSVDEGVGRMIPNFLR